LGESLVKVLGAKGDVAGQMLADTASQMKKYDAQAKEIQTEAERDDRSAEADESRALRYDLGEGLLEIALVVSSMYFIARKTMFPVIGVIAGISGIVIAASGLLA
jgi:hypothetical protein